MLLCHPLVKILVSAIFESWRHPTYPSQKEDSLIAESTQLVNDGRSLDREQMTQVVDSIMKGECSDKQIESLLVALYEKGETVEELAGAASAMRKHMTPIQTRRENVVDTCGTGGGKSGTFNISTAAAIVAAAAGASVAKHGNRASTSKTGSADVLVELGVNIECSVETVQKSLDQLGLCFCFAPLFHPSVKHVMKVRRRLAHPTIFNLLGPLCNPANAPFQVLGAGREETRIKLAEALSLLGTKRSIVVHSRDGLGEVSISDKTEVSEVHGKNVTEGILAPEDFGCETGNLTMLAATSPAESAEKIQRVLAGHSGPARDVVVANAAAALWVSGLCDGLLTGAERCSNAIDNGQAAEILKELADLTNRG
ncbi:MAG: anthranilate phosphoribosyltransferase [Mariniblastus sp.]|jgi:anthranilate phosphoribosyltransferase